MAKRRNTYFLRGGEIIDVEIFHDGNYGNPGKSRAKRVKPTKEQMAAVNAMQKMKKCRLRLLQYFDVGDLFATWTYEPKNRPVDMQEALQHFQSAMRFVRKQYKKRNRELFWIRNIERGTKGAWHIHLVINEIGETAEIVRKAWKRGGTFVAEIKLMDKFYDEDFTKLASYMAKDENTREEKENGEMGKPRLREANYNVSRNMPLPKPKVDKLVRWEKKPRVKQGYYIAKLYEGINPATGFQYRRYTMIRIRREQNGRIATSRYLC